MEFLSSNVPIFKIYMQSLRFANRDFSDCAVSFLTHCGSEAVYVLKRVWTFHHITVLPYWITWVPTPSIQWHFDMWLAVLLQFIELTEANLKTWLLLLGVVIVIFCQPFILIMKGAYMANGVIVLNLCCDVIYIIEQRLKA